MSAAFVPILTSVDSRIDSLIVNSLSSLLPQLLLFNTSKSSTTTDYSHTFSIVNLHNYLSTHYLHSQSEVVEFSGTKILAKKIKNTVETS